MSDGPLIKGDERDGIHLLPTEVREGGREGEDKTRRSIDKVK